MSAVQWSRSVFLTVNHFNSATLVSLYAYQPTLPEQNEDKFQRQRSEVWSTAMSDRGSGDF